MACPVVPFLKPLLRLTHPPQLPIKLANIFKNLILHHKDSPELVKLSTTDFAASCEFLLEMMLNPAEQEAKCQVLGNLFMAYLEFFAKQRSPQMMTALIRKLHKSSLPVTNQGIVVYLSFLIQSYSPDMLNFLSTLEVDRKNGLKILMDHWLLHQPKFSGDLSKLHTVRGLMHVFRYLDQSAHHECSLAVGRRVRPESLEIGASGAPTQDFEHFSEDQRTLTENETTREEPKLERQSTLENVRDGKQKPRASGNYSRR